MAGRLEQRPLDESHRVPSAKEQVETVPGVQKKSRFTVQEFEAPYYKSIRFRLTAWYAAALILVIVALSVSLHTLLVRALSNDAQSRLGNAVVELEDNISVVARLTSPRDPPDLGPYYAVTPPSFDSTLISGLWYSVFDNRRVVVEVDSPGGLSTIPDDLEDALGDDDVFEVDRNTFKSFQVGGVESMVLVAPFQAESVPGIPGPTAGWIVVGEPIGSRANIIQVVDQILRLFGVVGVALAVWGGWLMAGRALAPVERITQTADSIGNRDGTVSLSRRLEVPDTGDELSRLAHTFNRMLDRIEEAFNTQRRFVGDASHELRTPLTSVRGHVDVLLRQLRSDRAAIEKADLIEELGVVQLESGRMSRLIDDMLVLARTDAASQADILKLQPVSLDVLAREAFRTASHLATGQELTFTIDEPVTLQGDGDRLVQVMIILMDNAIRHTPLAGTVDLKVGRGFDPIEREWCASIRVSDTGCGIGAEHVPHLFERFYRAENARSRASGGTGLGLSIALTIVRGHLGWIDVDTAAGKGTVFTVWLPLAVPDQPEPPGTVSSPGSVSTVENVKRRMRLGLPGR
ncbi:MAG: HAMP domain-containing protein [Chloroflexia bacterium]|nr:HAMP domain-containing protein [Chloroflexia bacterium]